MNETFSVYFSSCHDHEGDDIVHHQLLVFAHAMHVFLVVARLAIAERGIRAVVLDNAINGIFGFNRGGRLSIRVLCFNIYCRRHDVSDLPGWTGDRAGQGEKEEKAGKGG